MFLDEIHRFNKAQQDALLPAVEDGLVTLIGATTENPYFEVNAALLSRTQVYELHELTAEDVEGLLRRALDRGAAADHEVPDEALSFLAERSGGDARTALAALELAAETTPAGEPVTLERAEDALQRRALRYDRAGDQHYNTISAWIKATRGSDPDASLYYLAVMLEGGEDARFIARRMVILASEDIGNADPQALVGGRRPRPGRRARRDARGRSTRSPRPPSTSRWRRSPTRPTGRSPRRASTSATHGAKAPPPALQPPRAASAPRALGRGQDYDYPHDHPGHVSGQELMPDALVGERFYEPDDAEATCATACRRSDGRAGSRTRNRPPTGAPATLERC